MDPKDFLKLGKELSNRDDEASLRTAVGRCYFGLFNYAKEFIEKYICELPENATAHKITYRYLNGCNLEKIVEIANILDNLRDQRNDADYDLKGNLVEKRSATMSYISANCAYNDLSNFISNSNRRQQLVKRIQQYKIKTNS